MELTGDLSDFALTDILQILALSRKTGTVLLENGSLAGTIIIEDGRITHASLSPGESFADGLVSRELLGLETLRKLKDIGRQSAGIWTVESLIVESGVMSQRVLQEEAKRHIQRAVGRLVGIEKGKFGIAINEASVTNPLDEIKLSEGLEVGEVLLGSAREIDEALRDQQINDPTIRPEDLGQSGDIAQLTGNRSYEHSMNPADNGHSQRSQLLCSLLAELRFHSYEAEVSLAIMRYASEVATRGILFVVKEFELCGQGQFGLGASAPEGAADRFVRSLRIPLDVDSLFSRVVRSGLPFVGPMPRDYWNMEILAKLGGLDHDLALFALPLCCNDRTVYVVYGDNYPGGTEQKGISELEALSSQASLVLEKISLERRVIEAESRISTLE
ncbi:MAG: DUF4388 domain-containing protein [Acidobacteriota bacterium]